MSILNPILGPVLGPVLGPIDSAVGVGFSPRSLFAASEQGAWYDPIDLSSLFQDTASVLPVTASGQPVGLRLDKRLGLVRGQDIFNSATASIAGTSQSLGGGAFRLYTPDGTYTAITSASSLIAGAVYEVSITVESITILGTGVKIGNLTNGPTVTTVGTFKFLYVADSGTCLVKRFGGPTDIRISGISFKMVSGNHASQATATARPLLQGVPYKIVYDGVDDVLNTTFPVSLGASCTVARSIPGTGAQILAAQTIGTSFADSTTSHALVIINRALTAIETTRLTAWLNRRAGL